MGDVLLDSPKIKSARCSTRAKVGVAGSTLAAMLGCCVAISGDFKFVDFALGYVGGERLLISPTCASFGKGQIGEHRNVVFHVWNATGAAVRIVGAKANCSCLAVTGLPMEIPSGHTAELNVDVELTDKLSAKAQPLVVFSDYSNMPQLCVSVSGRVVQ